MNNSTSYQAALERKSKNSPKYKSFELVEDNQKLVVTLNLQSGEEKKVFHLEEVGTVMLAVYRLSKTPFILIKKDGRFFVTKEAISKEYALTGCTFCGKNHKCSYGPADSGTCKRLLPLPDEEGGCEKVLDFNLARLEKYDWISFGAETVNTSFPSFMVLECEHRK